MDQRVCLIEIPIFILQSAERYNFGVVETERLTRKPQLTSPDNWNSLEVQEAFCCPLVIALY